MDEAEILSIFDMLGLRTQEQRDTVLTHTRVPGLEKQTERPGSRFVTWLSNNSEPLPNREVNNAKLEEPPG